MVIGRPIVKAAKAREAAEKIIKEIENGYREITQRFKSFTGG